MDAADEKKIREWLNRTGKEIVFDLILSGDVQGDAMKTAAEDLSAVSGKIRIKTKKDKEKPDSAAMIFPQIAVKGVLTGKILDMVLTMLEFGASRVAPETLERLEKIKAPLFLKLFVTPHCPHCPQVVKDITALSIANPNIHVEIVDGLLYTEKSSMEGVQAAPTLIFNENFRWVGQVRTGDVLDALTDVDPVNLSPESLLAMIEAGRAAAVADMMVNRGTVIPAILDLLLDEKWSVRLGAMVAAEELGLRNEELAFDLMEHLWSRYDAMSDPVKGDIVYLSGAIGPEKDVEKLNTLLEKKPGPEMMDALEDALAALAERRAQS
jgi:hypothetical protein